MRSGLVIKGYRAKSIAPSGRSDVSRSRTGNIKCMSWHDELRDIIESNSLVPSFDQWLDATGYRDYVSRIRSGPVNLQATGMNALYDYYQNEMKRRH